MILPASLFIVGAVISMATSWMLVSRLERIGDCLGLAEGLLGLVAALAADAPEVTSAVTAIVNHQTGVGTGVIIGSNVFNLAALLGLSSVLAVRITLHQKVIALDGAVALGVAVLAFLVTVRAVSAPGGLTVAILIFIPYAFLLGCDRSTLKRLKLSKMILGWFSLAASQQEVECRRRPGAPASLKVDISLAVAGTVVVVLASIIMERSATVASTNYSVPGIILGTLVLAPVTSLPNVMSSIYLARHGRGTAVLSIALNSNALNVLAGLLVPATILGLGKPSQQQGFIALWYLGITALTLGIGYVDRGFRRASGISIIVIYAAFVLWLLLLG